MADLPETINIVVSDKRRSQMIVGYHLEKDEIFVYFIDEDDLFWAFYKGGLTACFFLEHMSDTPWITLGEL